MKRKLDGANGNGAAVLKPTKEQCHAIETLCLNVPWRIPGDTKYVWTVDPVIRVQADRQAQMVVSWATQCQAWTALGDSSPVFLRGCRPIASFVLEHDALTATMEWIPMNATANLGESVAQVLFAMQTMRKVPVQHFADLLDETKHANAHVKIPAPDQQRLFNICTVLYKLQGGQTPMNLQVSIEEGPAASDTYRIYVSGLTSVTSDQLFLLLHPFWTEIDDVFIGWGMGDHLAKKALLVLSVWKAGHKIQSLWCSNGLVQTPIRSFSLPLFSAPVRQEPAHPDEPVLKRSKPNAPPIAQAAVSLVTVPDVAAVLELSSGSALPVSTKQEMSL